MAKPLVVYTHVPVHYNASSSYRILTPLETAVEMGLPIEPHIDSNLAGIDMEQRIRTFCESDVIMLYQPTGEANLVNVRGAKSILPSKQDDGWKHPPTFILDSDDNLFNVNPHNQAFKYLGIRDHEGNDIPNGHTIGCVQGGEKRILWQDKENGFDIAKNRYLLDTYRGLIDFADCVTTSRPTVAAAIERDAHPQRVKVWPNLVRFDHYPQVSLADEGRINILWQGGGAHYEDWFPLRDSLGKITKKYPEVHWMIWGVLYPWVTELIPPDRYTYERWCPYQEYRVRRAIMGDHINLAPLADNRFNRCRSAIKFYEASVLKHPAATLAQNTGPYKDEIIEGQTGLLWDDTNEFESKLSTLIEDAKLRRELAGNAKDWVSENRDAFKHVPRWVAWLQELRAEIQRDQPRMPDRAWEKFSAEMQAQAEAEANAPSENGEVDAVTV